MIPPEPADAPPDKPAELPKTPLMRFQINAWQDIGTNIVVCAMRTHDDEPWTKTIIPKSRLLEAVKALDDIIIEIRKSEPLLKYQ